MAVEVVPLEPGIAAEIRNVDLANISDRDFETVYQAFLDHLVLAVRGQRFTIEQFLRYSRRFGKPVPHVLRKTRHPDHPELTVMGMTREAIAARNARNDPADSAILKRGEGWHSDSAFLQEPAKATQLYALEIPSYGGDTLFANMYAAYDALPDSLKQQIAGLQASYRQGGKEQAMLSLFDEEDKKRAPVTHPVVRVHPETGKKALYANPVHILGITGLTDKESDELLTELSSRMLLPGCEYRHKWQVGDVVIWDNRCLIHSATGGYPVDEPRVHWRTTIFADGVRERAPRAAA